SGAATGRTFAEVCEGVGEKKFKPFSSASSWGCCSPTSSTIFVYITFTANPLHFDNVHRVSA
ncbi:MAG: hypothetical protein OXH57_06030, partial [Ekhidna sp.]|nr:hypothetical protein [Ekhidna sp.]